MSDKQKIMKYLDYKRISKSNFYKKTGFSNGFLDSGSSITLDKLRIILDKYHDFSLNWLVYEKGEMLVENEHFLQKVGEPEEKYEKNSSDIKVWKDLVEMQKEYIENLKRQLANCEDKLNTQKNTG